MYSESELFNLTDEEIIKYILELSGYNDIIYTVKMTLKQ